MKRKIIFRVDSDKVNGFEHLSRCSALAQMLCDEYEISFYFREISEELSHIIKRPEIRICRITYEEEFFNKLSGNTIVVLDGYNFNTDYQKKIKNTNSKLVCIDEIYDKEYFADVIINFAPGIKPDYYKAQLSTQFALGPDYTLLRPKFLEQAKITRKLKKIDSVLICFGGEDPKNLTRKTLQIVKEFTQFKKIIVIVGAAYQKTEDLNDYLKSDSRIDLRQNPDEHQMLNSMLEAELAIVPVGTILCEAIVAGCRVISGMSAENQKDVYRNWKDAGIFIGTDDFKDSKLVRSINRVLKSLGQYKSMIDGLSAIRLKKLFNILRNDPLICLREVSDQDIDLTYKWATDPGIRRFAFGQNEIKRSDHIKWLLNKLNDRNCFFYIAELNNCAIGSIRFEVKRKRAILNYLLDPESHGKGYGQIILIKGLEKLLELNNQGVLSTHVVVGDVMHDNISSIKSLLRAGFAKKNFYSFYRFYKLI